jgi:hypothetical protein
MQESFIASPTWTQTVLGWVASFVTGATILKLVTIWLNRRKPAAEVHVTEATATEITVRASSSASEAVIRMMDRLDGAQLTIDSLRSDNAKLKADLGAALLRAANAEDDAKAQRMFVGQLNAAAKLTICEHHPNGVRLADFTPRELNPPKE